MPDFIKLTLREDGTIVYLRKDMVAAFAKHGNATSVSLAYDDMDMEVTETPEQILRWLSKGK